MRKLGREEVAEASSVFLKNILEKSHLDIDLEQSFVEGDVKLDLTGPDAELLLLDNARLLYAFNHLVNQIFYRQSLDGCNFLLDCENYRSSRETELALMAEKAAEKVKVSGTAVSLQPMPSGERRIIHLALADSESVVTESEGTGHRRRVLILPAG